LNGKWNGKKVSGCVVSLHDGLQWFVIIWIALHFLGFIEV